MQAATSRATQLAGLSVVLAALTWLIFGQTLKHGFLNYDDDRYVYSNPQVTGGLTLYSARWAFTHSHSGNWHPLTSLSHMLDCQLYGLNAGGHHFTNVLLHTATVVVLFLVLTQLTGTVWRSAFVAAICAIHPLRVESVAWVSERKDVLSGLFFMLTLAAYLLYVKRPNSILRALTVGALFSAGLMSKPTLVTMPFVLLLLDYWPLRRFEKTSNRRQIILEKLPLVLLSVASCVATLLAQRQTIVSVRDLPLILRLGNAFVTCLVYLWQMVYPMRLAVFYPHPGGDLRLWQVIGALLTLGLITTSFFLLRRRFPYLIVGWLWYLGMLAPVIGVVQVGSQARADRYTYLPHIGISLLVVWAAYDLALNRRAARVCLGLLAIAITAALTWLAGKQATYWQSAESLWRHALAVTTRNEVAHNGLGYVYLNDNRLLEAITECRTALEIRPDYETAGYNLSLALAKTGRNAEAIEQLRAILQRNPKDSTAHRNLGDVFVGSGELDQAIDEYQKALSLQPIDLEAHYNLGSSYLQRGELPQAIGEFEKAVALDPHYAAALYNLGNSFFEQGDLGRAINYYQEALRVRPDYADGENNLALALYKKGRGKEARTHWDKALQLQPDFPDAQSNLAWVLATSADQTIRDGARALDLARGMVQSGVDTHPRMLRTLAAAFAENGRFAEAKSTATRGLDMATTQGDLALAEAFQLDLSRYQANLPLRACDAL